MKVLITLDEEASSSLVLDWARRLPTLFKQEPHIALLHVVPIPLDGILGVQQQTYGLDLEHFKAAVASRLPDLEQRYEVRLVSGKPGEVICQHAADFDLVVLGAPRRSRMAELWLGGTCTYVTHNAPCAVLVLPTISRVPAA